jgi:predicted nucleotidyltransferase
MDKDLENLKKILGRLKEEGKISLAYLYGSYASGSQHERSDIDLAIYLNSRDENRRIEIIDEILMSTDKSIELLLLDDEDESPFVIQKALKGIPLIEPDSETFYMLAHRALHETEAIRYKREFAYHD